MTQKPPSRQPSASKRTTPAKPTSSRTSSGRAAANSLPDLSKMKLPKGTGCASSFIVIAGIILFCLVGGFIALNLNEEGDDTATRAPITPGSTRVATTTLPTRTEDETPVEADWYQIYFTDADCPSEEERGEGLDSIIAETISQAEVSVDIAVFELDSEPIVEALIGLEEQGIPVRVVVDTDYIEESSIRRLRRNGISVVEDDRSAFMHNKFTVIDGRYVWVGSMNYMPNDIYCNNNNLVWPPTTPPKWTTCTTMVVSAPIQR